MLLYACVHGYYPTMRVLLNTNYRYKGKECAIASRRQAF
jgi:hypothetical protein